MPNCVKLFKKENPQYNFILIPQKNSKIVSSSSLKPFNEDNNRLYKNGIGENSDEIKAEYIRAYVFLII